MPYEKVAKLPKGGKDNLPRHAQVIYLETYINAWEQTHH